MKARWEISSRAETGQTLNGAGDMKGAVGTQRGVTHPEKPIISYLWVGDKGGFSETGESREELRDKGKKY